MMKKENITGSTRYINILIALSVCLIFILSACSGASKEEAPSFDTQTSVNETDVIEEKPETIKDETDKATSSEQTDAEEPSKEDVAEGPQGDKQTVSEEKYDYNVSELSFYREGIRIYGELYMPKADGKVPVVILSHGLGVDHTVNADYAAAFAESGSAAFVFDFAGGSLTSLSDGQPEDMTVLTEAADLNAVIDEVRNLEFIDENKVFLFGESQGGFISTYVAANRPEDIAGLIALYPAYILRDLCSDLSDSFSAIPDQAYLYETEVGRKYFEDIEHIDIYGMMKDYPRPVLIIHGTDDNKVPLDYPKQAAEAFPNAELITIEGAEHGFSGTDKAAAASYATGFVSKICY